MNLSVLPHLASPSFLLGAPANLFAMCRALAKVCYIPQLAASGANCPRPNREIGRAHV